MRRHSAIHLLVGNVAYPQWKRKCEANGSTRLYRSVVLGSVNVVVVARVNRGVGVGACPRPRARPVSFTVFNVKRSNASPVREVPRNKECTGYITQFILIN